jgi:hypothetical protein
MSIGDNIVAFSKPTIAASSVNSHEMDCGDLRAS